MRRSPHDVPFYHRRVLDSIRFATVGLTASRLQAVHEGHRRGCVRLASPGALGVRHRDHQNLPAGGDTHVGKPRPCPCGCPCRSIVYVERHSHGFDFFALCFLFCVSRCVFPALRLLCGCFSLVLRFDWACSAFASRLLRVCFAKRVVSESSVTRYHTRCILSLILTVPRFDRRSP